MGEKTARRVLVLGDYRQTITVVRSLARAGCEVTLGTHDPASSTALSRYVSDVWLYDGSSTERFQNHLEAFVRSEKPNVVFVVGETQLRRIGPVAARLEPLAVWAAPAFDTVQLCFDKSAMYRLTRALGVPTAPWHEYGGAEAWRRAAREMGFPLVIKRKDSSASVLGKKALIVDGPEAFNGALAALERDPDPGSLILQKFARGVRHNCHIAAADGKLVAYFEQSVVRTDETDGTGIGVEGVSAPPSPALRGYCERITERLKYTGIGCIQFMVERGTGKVAFLEMNPRMDSTAALPCSLGYDYPLLAVQLAVYRRMRESGAMKAAEAVRPKPVTHRYSVGKRYHWLYGDLLSWIGCARRRAAGPRRLAAWLLQMLRAAAGSRHLTFDLLDPLPTLHMYARKLRALSARRLPSAVRVKSRPLLY